MSEPPRSRRLLPMEGLVCLKARTVCLMPGLNGTGDLPSFQGRNDALVSGVILLAAFPYRQAVSTLHLGALLPFSSFVESRIVVLRKRKNEDAHASNANAAQLPPGPAQSGRPACPECAAVSSEAHLVRLCGARGHQERWQIKPNSGSRYA